MLRYGWCYVICVALSSTTATAAPLPYTNTYGSTITAPGQVTVSLKTATSLTSSPCKTGDNRPAPCPARVGVAFENSLNNAEYVNADTPRTFNVVQPQIMEFEVLNVPDNGKLWFPAGIQGVGGDYSQWPNFGFSSSDFGKQVSTWDFGAAGILTITDTIVTPQEIALQVNARVQGENVVKNALAQRTAIANGSATLACSPDEGPYHGPFDRGFCSTMYCGNQPESWVRGQAEFDRRSGQVTYVLELETDSTTDGPVGVMHVDVLDANGGILATVDSNEQGIGGKAPGHSRINNWTGYKNLAMPIPAKASGIKVRAECTGKFVQQLWGVDFGKLLDTAKAVVTILGAAGGG